MKIVFAALLATLAASILAFLLYGRENTWALLAGPADPGRYDFRSGRRSSSDNDALACTTGFCQEPDFVVPPRPKTPEQTIDDLAHRLQRIDPLARRVDDGTTPGYARFVTYSPVMRFPDAIDIEAMPTGDGTAIRAYARARLGRSDFGANLARLKTLLVEE